jgi:hypothetical protein
VNSLFRPFVPSLNWLVSLRRSLAGSDAAPVPPTMRNLRACAAKPRPAIPGKIQTAVITLVSVAVGGWAGLFLTGKGCLESEIRRHRSTLRGGRPGVAKMAPEQTAG